MSEKYPRLEKIVGIIMGERKLSDPEEIRGLSDLSILTCPSIGRKSLTAIRQTYPHNREITVERPSTQRFVRPRLPRLEIEIGSIHDVIAARVERGRILIRTRGHRELLAIGLPGYPRDETRVGPESLGFGEIPQSALIRMGCYFPTLPHTLDVHIDNLVNNGEYFTGELRVETATAVFILRLFGDDELLGDVAEECDYEGLSFEEEIESDPEIGPVCRDVDNRWRAVLAVLDTGNPENVINWLCDVAPVADRMMRLIISRAELRGISIDPQPFRLTSTDDGSVEVSADDAEHIGLENFFADGMSPVDLVGIACRQFLAERRPMRLTVIRQKLDALPSTLVPGIGKFMDRCAAISAEIESVDKEIVATGVEGVLRKEVIERSQLRDGVDGMTIRAVKRWIDARILRGELIKINSRRGIVLRQPDTCNLAETRDPIRA